MVWQIFAFLAPVMQVVLLFAIAANMTNMSDVFILGCLGVVALNVLGYVMDKFGFFIEHRRRGFEIYEKQIQMAQLQYQSAWVSKFLRMTEEEVDEQLNKIRKIFGITEEEDLSLVLEER